jgi:predicted DNA-binding transcriptional regulator YafY
MAQQITLPAIEQVMQHLQQSQGQQGTQTQGRVQSAAQNQGAGARTSQQATGAEQSQSAPGQHRKLERTDVEQIYNAIRETARAAGDTVIWGN